MANGIKNILFVYKQLIYLDCIYSIIQNPTPEYKTVVKIPNLCQNTSITTHLCQRTWNERFFEDFLVHLLLIVLQLIIASLL